MVLGAVAGGVGVGVGIDCVGVLPTAGALVLELEDPPPQPPKTLAKSADVRTAIFWERVTAAPLDVLEKYQHILNQCKQYMNY